MSRLAFLLLCASPLVAAPVPKAKEKPTLEGAWEVLERQFDGKPQQIPGGREFWVFRGSNVSVYYVQDESKLQQKDAESSTMQLVLPDDSDVTQIDLVQTLGRVKQYTSRCRVELDADVLKVALRSGDKNPRPEKCEAAAGIAFIKFKRVDPEKLKAK